MISHGDLRKPCCRPEAGNLTRDQFSYMGRIDLTYRICRKCGCRHFEAEAEPGRFGIVQKPMGTVVSRGE